MGRAVEYFFFSWQVLQPRDQVQLERFLVLKALLVLDTDRLRKSEHSQRGHATLYSSLSRYNDTVRDRLLIIAHMRFGFGR